MTLQAELYTALQSRLNAALREAEQMRQSGFFDDLEARFDAISACKKDADAAQKHLDPEQELRERLFLKQLRRCDTPGTLRCDPTG